MNTNSQSSANKVMSAVKSVGTKPEVIVRRGLWMRGFRYRLNHKRLPGHPDLVLRKYRTCIFVNGCFWHKHSCKYFVWPKTREEYWRKKIERNVLRDIEVYSELENAGWRVIIVWECE